MRKLFLATLLLGSALMVNAQSGTNSPYSQYGLGILSDQTSGFNRGMNGVGLGFHEHNQVNYLNPASYASIDSMTFILDAGISGQVTNFEENGVKKNANNSNFEYVVAGFRLLPHVGMSFGIIPFTNVGYNYSASEWVNADKEAYYTNTYSGDGGLHQAYIGAGWEPVKGLAVGANFSYLWGSIDRSVSNSYSNSYYKTLTRYYSMQVNSYKVDFGEFTDYVQPDAALDSGDIDVNLMQHKKYLDGIVENQGLKLKDVVNVPTLGLGVFSDKYKSFDEVPEGAQIGIPTDAVNLSRALGIAKDLGIITLKTENNDQKASIADIKDNPKNYKFVPMEAAQISRSLDSIDVGFVPGNYAYAAGMDYSKALGIEKVSEPIKNVVAVAAKNENTIGKLFKDAVESKEFVDAINNDHEFDAFTRPAWWPAK